MWSLGCVLGPLLCLTTAAQAQSGACTRDTSGLQVIDMCEWKSWTLGRVYISVNSTNMGSSTRCNCTLRGKTASQNTATSFTLWNQGGTSTTGCGTHHTLRVTWPSPSGGSGGGSQNFTCLTARDTSPVSPQSTKDVTLSQTRSGTSVVSSFCLFLQPEKHADNNIELTCQNDVEQTTSNTVSSSSSLSTPSTASSTVPPSSAASSGSGGTASSDPTMVTSDVASTATSSSHSSRGGVTSSSTQPSDPFPVIPVVGGVVGGVVLIIVIVIVVVCTRRKRQPKPPTEHRPEAQNTGYENSLTDNILYESHYSAANGDAVQDSNQSRSSSAPAVNQSPPSFQSGADNGGGIYACADGDGENSPVPYYNTSAEAAKLVTENEASQVTQPADNEYAVVNKPRRSAAPKPEQEAAAAAPQPTTEEYAVVNKPKRQNPAEEPGSAAVTSSNANVTLPCGDVYAVVDKPRAKGGNQKQSYLPPPKSPPPVPAPKPTTPGLLYADRDQVTGQGSESSPRSSEIPTETDYAGIDNDKSSQL